MNFDDVQKAYDTALLLADRDIIKLVAASVIANQMDGNPVWLMIVTSSSGGKCMGKDTRILMHDGTIKNIQNIIVGDTLMGDDSSPRLVLSTTNGIDDLYKVEQENGDDYIVNSEHVLTLKYTIKQKLYSHIKPGTILDIPLPEYLKRSETFRRVLKGVKTEVEYPHTEVTVDPYWLGLWLGDGRCDGPVVYKPDHEIRDYCAQYAKTLTMSMTIRDENRCPGYAIVNTKGAKNPLTEKMRAYGLMPKKFIPNDYLINNRSTRLALLAGLIDSDGHRSARGGRFEFTNKNEELANNTVRLARSLGFKTSIQAITKGIKDIGFVGSYFQVNITGNIQHIPTIIRRKQAPPHQWKRDQLTTGIRVVSNGRGEYYGFTLDGNGRYLLADHTITHNTAILMTLDELEFIPGKRVTFFISDLTENTLASGFKVAGGGDASLLNKMPVGGMMIFKDFTSMLSKRHESRDAIMGQLREVYDRKFDKPTGNNQDVKWSGRVGALAGVTEAVHEYMAAMSTMGDRFIMYSPKQPDRRELLRFIMKLKTDKDNQEKRLKNARSAMQEYLKICVNRIDEAKMIMQPEHQEYLMEVADFVTKARSGVIEDPRTGAVKFVPSAEMPTRLIDQLLSIGSALCLIRLVDGKSPALDENDMLLLYKIAFDSIPLKRLWALRQLAIYMQGVSTAGIAATIGYETGVVSQWLAQLNGLGIIDRMKNAGRGDMWSLKPEFRQLMITYQHIKTKDEILEDPGADDDELFSEEALRF